MAKKALIIGGGFAGCASAEMLHRKGFESTLVEKAPFLGGGCKTFYCGGHPYTVGPRHFLTKRQDVYDYICKFLPMRRIPEHEFLTYIERDRAFYNFPIHKDDIERMPDRDLIKNEINLCKGVENSKNLEEFWLNSVGKTLYSKFVESYSKKMWGIESNTELDVFNYTAKGVAIKEGSKACWEGAISAFPINANGYDDFFDVSTKDAKVLLNTTITEFDIPNYKVKFNGEWHSYDLIINTISPEYLFKQEFGPLRWMGRDFIPIVLPIANAFPPNIYFLYYANQEPFTRIVEYKRFYRYESPQTLLGLEIPSLNNKLYPFTTQKDQAAAQRYIDLLPEKVFSLGRAAQYRYIDVAMIFEKMFDIEKLI